MSKDVLSCLPFLVGAGESNVRMGEGGAAGQIEAVVKAGKEKVS